MILNFKDDFHPEQVILDLLKQKKYTNSSYFSLRVISKKHKINFLKLFCAYITESELREYIYQLHKEIKQK